MYETENINYITGKGKSRKYKICKQILLEDVEMIFKDYYKILGLETNKVNEDEIRIAFREQAKKYHPDVNTRKFYC